MPNKKLISLPRNKAIVLLNSGITVYVRTDNKQMESNVNLFSLNKKGIDASLNIAGHLSKHTPGGRDRYWNSLIARIKNDFKAQRLRYYTANQKEAYTIKNGKVMMPKMAKGGETEDLSGWDDEELAYYLNVDPSAVTDDREGMEEQATDLMRQDPDNMGKGGKITAKYDMDAKKAKTIRKKGNIITFKKPFGATSDPHTQIMVTGIEKSGGSIKILGRFYDTPWYDSEKALYKAIDFKRMEAMHMEEGGILSSDEEQDFKTWIDDGNAFENKKGIWTEQTTQWKKEFTTDELKSFFKREYMKAGGTIKNTMEEIYTMSDGHSFKSVTLSYAKKNWNKKEIYGLEGDTETLIQSKSDIKNFDNFGVEIIENSMRAGGTINLSKEEQDQLKKLRSLVENAKERNTPKNFVDAAKQGIKKLEAKIKSFEKKVEKTVKKDVKKVEKTVKKSISPSKDQRSAKAKVVAKRAKEIYAVEKKNGMKWFEAIKAAYAERTAKNAPAKKKFKKTTSTKPKKKYKKSATKAKPKKKFKRTLTGSTNLKRDKARKAKPPGKRVSASGKIYYEGRKNRADIDRRIRLGKGGDFVEHLVTIDYIDNDGEPNSWRTIVNAPMGYDPDLILDQGVSSFKEAHKASYMKINGGDVFAETQKASKGAVIKERKYTSQQKHEQVYKKYRKSKVQGYKKKK